MLDNYTLSDTAIAQIAKVLQIAILTGTDITDNLRLMSFVQDGGKLVLDPSYEETFNENLGKMLLKVPTSVTEDVNEPQQ